jgi:hypothetical protein
VALVSKTGSTMNKLTLGTGQITKIKDGCFLLRYMNHGSFIVGERTYNDPKWAIEFCRERGIRVVGV